MQRYDLKKKHILFIVPSLSIGGTISSLNNIYRLLKDKCEITVFAVSPQGTALVEFGNRVKYDYLLSLYAGTYPEFKGREKFLALFVKVIKRICLCVGIRIEPFILNRAARWIERTILIDKVVGFEEGIANNLASIIRCYEKYAWVHCDYRYYSGKEQEETIYERFKKIICVSKYTADSFAKIYPSLSSKVVYIYNLFDFERIANLAMKYADDERFTHEDFTIISIGRIAKIKRFEKIPEIAKELKSRKLKFHWFIVGSGDKSIEDMIQKKIELLGVKNNVVPLGSKKNPFPYLSKSDLLVCLSESEACPMVFIESKSLGVPIVSADFGSAKEFVAEGVEGFVVPLKDIADTIGSIISNPILIKDKCMTVNNIFAVNMQIEEQLEQLIAR